MIEINNANRRAINQAKELLNTVLEMNATDTEIALRIALLSFLRANGVNAFHSDAERQEFITENVAGRWQYTTSEKGELFLVRIGSRIQPTFDSDVTAKYKFGEFIKGEKRQ